MKGGDGNVEEAMSAANLLAETIHRRSRTPHGVWITDALSGTLRCLLQLCHQSRWNAGGVWFAAHASIVRQKGLLSTGMQLMELGNLTPMPPNIAKNEDLLGEALHISLGSSITGASWQTDCRIFLAMARGRWRLSLMRGRIHPEGVQ
jgi:hypothetical protein